MFNCICLKKFIKIVLQNADHLISEIALHSIKYDNIYSDTCTSSIEKYTYIL